MDIKIVNHRVRFDDPGLNNPRYHARRLLHDMAKLAMVAATSGAKWSHEKKSFVGWLVVVDGRCPGSLASIS